MGVGNKAVVVSRTCQGKRCESLINAWVILKISVLILSLNVGFPLKMVWRNNSLNALELKLMLTLFWCRMSHIPCKKVCRGIA